MITNKQETWIESATGGFYLEDMRAWKYQEQEEMSTLTLPSILSIFLKGEDELRELRFLGVEAEHLLKTVKEFKC